MTARVAVFSFQSSARVRISRWGSNSSVHGILPSGMRSFTSAFSLFLSCQLIVPTCSQANTQIQIFGETPTSLEDLIKEHGELIKKGTLSEDGNFEVWADGSETERKREEGQEPWQQAEQKVLERMGKGEDVNKVKDE